MRWPWIAVLFLMVFGVATAAAAPRSGLLKTKAATLWYEVRGRGDGPPLMVINGGPGVSHEYMLISDVWDTFARGRRVVFYDQRGVGLSPRLAKGQSCTLADQIDDLDALRAHLGVERMDVLGHSWGGVLAMAYGARHPEHVARMIICDSGAPKWEDTKYLFADVFPETNERFESFAFGDLLGDTAATNAGFREYQGMLACDPERRTAMRTRPLPAFSPDVSQAIDADVRRFDLGPEIAKFRFPTLVITGRFDANVAPAVAWKIHKAIPGSEFVVFERSGHLPFYEEPEAFVERVERFLGGR